MQKSHRQFWSHRGVLKKLDTQLKMISLLQPDDYEKQSVVIEVYSTIFHSADRMTNKYSKTLVCRHYSFQKHACNAKHLYIKVNFKNYQLTCDHVMCGFTYYSYCKTSLIYQVKICQKRLLVLQNSCRASYLQSKVSLYFLLPQGVSYMFFPPSYEPIPYFYLLNTFL